MEQIEDLEHRVLAFHSRLSRFLDELEILAPTQRRLIEDASAIDADLEQLRAFRSQHHSAETLQFQPATCSRPLAS